MNCPLSLTLTLLLTIGSCLFGFDAARADDDDWVSIFNGENLDGWTQINGTAEYRVEEGCIVGMTVAGSPNSFLCSDKLYGDFELELDVFDDPLLNSGIQIRSNSLSDYRDGRVHGYQVEIAANGTSGFIYDEARRGWLSTDRRDPEKNGAFKNGEWNHYRIRFVGDHLQTWINDVPIADLHDDMTATGFIGLQVHSYRGAEPVEVRWRNIRIREIDE